MELTNVAFDTLKDAAHSSALSIFKKSAGIVKDNFVERRTDALFKDSLKSYVSDFILWEKAFKEWMKSETDVNRLIQLKCNLMDNFDKIRKDYFPNSNYGYGFGRILRFIQLEIEKELSLHFGKSRSINSSIKLESGKVLNYKENSITAGICGKSVKYVLPSQFHELLKTRGINPLTILDMCTTFKSTVLLNPLDVYQKKYKDTKTNSLSRALNLSLSTNQLMFDAAIMKKPVGKVANTVFEAAKLRIPMVIPSDCGRDIIVTPLIPRNAENYSPRIVEITYPIEIVSDIIKLNKVI